MIKGDTKLLGVLGYPVAHSLSPLLHNHWLQQYAINAAYVPLSLPPDKFERAFTSLIDVGFSGFNITVPHKQTVAGLPFVQKDALSTILHSVNTVKVGDNNDVYGYSTDGYGFYQGLGLGITLKGAIVIIGAGGAAAPIARVLREKFPLTEIRLINRTHAKAEQLNIMLNLHASIYDWNNIQAFTGVSLIVNTSSLGMKGESIPVSFEKVANDAIAYDIIYSPRKTLFLQQAAAAGLRTINGLAMLMYQAQQSFEHWFNIKPVVTSETFSLLEKHLES